ncbi:MAG: mycofactocin-coupled SDR family oxidoreductase [Rhodococcus fascians]
MGLLEGKVGFITGAGHGQGRSHAVRMAQEGADVILSDLCAPVPQVQAPMATEDELAETARLVEKEGRRAVFGIADVRDRGALQAVADRGLAEFGHIDVVSANAGVWIPRPFVEIDEDEYDAIVDISLKGAWNTCQVVVPTMIEQGTGGSIVITSSAGGLRGQAPYAHYVAAKHGVVGLMRALANELAKYDIRVNTVHPTGVNTFMPLQPIVADVAASEPLFIQGAANMLNVGAIEAEDVSNAVIWLMSSEARWITGVTLPVDAGNTNKP